MLTALQCTLNHAETDDRKCAGRTSDQNVVLRKNFREVDEPDGFCTDRFRQSCRSGDGAVCDGNVLRFLCAEMSGTELNHFSGTDKQDVGVF